MTPKNTLTILQYNFRESKNTVRATFFGILESRTTTSSPSRNLEKTPSLIGHSAVLVDLVRRVAAAIVYFLPLRGSCSRTSSEDAGCALCRA